MIQLSQQTEALARSIAGTRRMPVDAVIHDALAAAHANILSDRPGTRDASPAAVARRQAAFTQLSEAIAALPLLDGRQVQEIIDDINAA